MKTKLLIAIILLFLIADATASKMCPSYDCDNMRYKATNYIMPQGEGTKSANWTAEIYCTHTGPGGGNGSKSVFDYDGIVYAQCYSGEMESIVYMLNRTTGAYIGNYTASLGGGYDVAKGNEVGTYLNGYFAWKTHERTTNERSELQVFNSAKTNIKYIDLIPADNPNQVMEYTSSPSVFVWDETGNEVFVIQQMDLLFPSPDHFRRINLTWYDIDGDALSGYEIQAPYNVELHARSACVDGTYAYFAKENGSAWKISRANKTENDAGEDIAVGTLYGMGGDWWDNCLISGDYLVFISSGMNGTIINKDTWSPICTFNADTSAWGGDTAHHKYVSTDGTHIFVPNVDENIIYKIDLSDCSIDDRLTAPWLNSGATIIPGEYELIYCSNVGSEGRCYFIDYTTGTITKNITNTGHLLTDNFFVASGAILTVNGSEGSGTQKVSLFGSAVSYVAEGGSCSDDSDCGPGTVCLDGTCKDELENGQRCNDTDGEGNAECLSGYCFLLGDGEYGECRSWECDEDEDCLDGWCYENICTYWTEFGECYNDSDCSDNRFCVYGRPTYCTMQSAVGTTCYRNHECKEDGWVGLLGGTSCSVHDSNADAGDYPIQALGDFVTWYNYEDYYNTSGTCTPNWANETCTDNANCTALEFCSALGVCLTRNDINGSCRTNAHCKAGLNCINYQCVNASTGDYSGWGCNRTYYDSLNSVWTTGGSCNDSTQYCNEGSHSCANRLDMWGTCRVWESSIGGSGIVARDYVCKDGLHCVGDKCAPESWECITNTGEYGRCPANQFCETLYGGCHYRKYAGQSCDYTYECKAGLNCNNMTGICVNRTGLMQNESYSEIELDGWVNSIKITDHLSIKLHYYTRNKEEIQYGACNLSIENRDTGTTDIQTFLIKKINEDYETQYYANQLLPGTLSIGNYTLNLYCKDLLKDHTDAMASFDFSVREASYETIIKWLRKPTTAKALSTQSFKWLYKFKYNSTGITGASCVLKLDYSSKTVNEIGSGQYNATVTMPSMEGLYDITLTCTKAGMQSASRISSVQVKTEDEDRQCIGDNHYECNIVNADFGDYGDGSKVCDGTECIESCCSKDSDCYSLDHDGNRGTPNWGRFCDTEARGNSVCSTDSSRSVCLYKLPLGGVCEDDTQCKDGVCRDFDGDGTSICEAIKCFTDSDCDPGETCDNERNTCVSNTTLASLDIVPLSRSWYNGILVGHCYANDLGIIIRANQPVQIAYDIIHPEDSTNAYFYNNRPDTIFQANFLKESIPVMINNVYYGYSAWGLCEFDEEEKYYNISIFATTQNNDRITVTIPYLVVKVPFSANVSLEGGGESKHIYRFEANRNTTWFVKPELHASWVRVNETYIHGGSYGTDFTYNHEALEDEQFPNYYWKAVSIYNETKQGQARSSLPMLDTSVQDWYRWIKEHPYIVYPLLLVILIVLPLVKVIQYERRRGKIR